MEDRQDFFNYYQYIYFYLYRFLQFPGLIFVAAIDGCDFISTFFSCAFFFLLIIAILARTPSSSTSFALDPDWIIAFSNSFFSFCSRSHSHFHFQSAGHSLSISLRRQLASNCYCIIILHPSLAWSSFCASWRRDFLPAPPSI